jgi:RNA-splicing ligase RtcB
MAQLKNPTQPKKRGAKTSANLSAPAAKKSKVEAAGKRRAIPVTTKGATALDSEGSDEEGWENEDAADEFGSGNELSEEDSGASRTTKPPKDPQGTF